MAGNSFADTVRRHAQPIGGFDGPACSGNGGGGPGPVCRPAVNSEAVHDDAVQREADMKPVAGYSFGRISRRTDLLRDQDRSVRAGPRPLVAHAGRPWRSADARGHTDSWIGWEVSR